MGDKPFSVDMLSSPLLAGLERRVQQAQTMQQSVTSAKTDGKSAHDKEIEKAAAQFEGLLLHEMFKEMWATVPKSGLLSGSREEEIYQDMFQNALAESVSANNSMGIKDVIIRDIRATETRQKKAGPDGTNGAS